VRARERVSVCVCERERERERDLVHKLLRGLVLVGSVASARSAISRGRRAVDVLPLLFTPVLDSGVICPHE
jgi:hypothetical protein